jgi:hypothetical protein
LAAKAIERLRYVTFSASATAFCFVRFGVGGEPVGLLEDVQQTVAEAKQLPKTLEY